jgi:mortality factor 4-like protein 1
VYRYITRFVHSWDEWVPETRILRWTEDNIKMQSRLKALYRTKQTPKTSSSSGTNSLGKRRRDAKNEKEEDYLKKPELRLDIPDTLKGQLVDDWENVTKNQQLVTLPRTVNVNDVLARYKRFKKDKKGSREL